MPRILYTFLTIILLIVIGIGLIGEGLVRPNNQAIGNVPFDVNAKSISLKTATNEIVAGWFIKGNPGYGAVLLLHGVHGNRLQMADRAKFLNQQGYSVCLIDLAAHGESGGDHITFGLKEAEGVKTALAFLVKELPGEKIAVIGVSLGAASIVLANRQLPPDAMVLESMYPTIEDAINDRLDLHLGKYGHYLAPLLLWQLPLRLNISPEQLKPIAEMPKIHVPVLITAGTDDQHTTLSETQRIFQAANEPKELWILEGAEHVDLYQFDPKAYEARVLKFLDRNIRNQS